MPPPRPDGHPRRSLTDAKARGWGEGWPTDRHADTKVVSVDQPDGGGQVRVRVRDVIAPLVEAVLETAVAVGYDLEPASCGGYNNRPMKRTDGTLTETPSNHSWGIAFDLNWNRNLMKSGKIVTDLPDEVVQRAFELGFSWGGWWGGGNGQGLFDCMHFEFRLDIDEARDLVAKLAGGTPRIVGRARGAGTPRIQRVDPGPLGPRTLEAATLALGPINAPLAALERTASDLGAVAVAQDAGVFCWGDAAFVGSLAGTPLAAPVVDLALSSGGLGYWLVGDDGGVFCFGDALPGQDGLGNLSPVGQDYWVPRHARAIDRFEQGYMITATTGETYHYFVLPRRSSRRLRRVPTSGDPGS